MPRRKRPRADDSQDPRPARRRRHPTAQNDVIDLTEDSEFDIPVHPVSHASGAVTPGSRRDGRTAADPSPIEDEISDGGRSRGSPGLCLQPEQVDQRHDDGHPRCTDCLKLCGDKLCLAEHCGCIRCLDCGTWLDTHAHICTASVDHARLYNQAGGRLAIVAYWDGQCPITTEEYDHPVAIKNCGHIFSFAALQKWSGLVVKVRSEDALRQEDIEAPHNCRKTTCPLCCGPIGEVICVGNWWETGEADALLDR